MVLVWVRPFEYIASFDPKSRWNRYESFRAPGHENRSVQTHQPWFGDRRIFVYTMNAPMCIGFVIHTGLRALTLYKMSEQRDRRPLRFL